ncbi:phosphatase PAP2 family protein [Gloeocapsa sp. PCC 73106]|uniref:phosphatase PAP2 family protein n=1 Tax=Gloeocapsa sp. PCC 73106 TaxID=102232 RepID=UPI0002AC795C|nr:phosphatase PAP2 family protein [Gloeocapsa sp. PCC 73106]ELR98104.1 membrane-associated phospholipid phosphatase [Gloeocapsa sp. PCC 73106]
MEEFNGAIKFLISFIPYFSGGLVASFVVLGSGAIIARSRLSDWVLSTEKEILLTLKANANAHWDAWMIRVTFLPQGQITIPLLLVTGSLLIYHQELASALMLGINLSGSWLLNGIFKLSFRRQRPNLWVLPTQPTDYSYPSGHSMSAISFYGLLAVYTSVFLSIPIIITGAIASVISMLVGFSRMYLGVHWASDVLGGWIAGSIWLSVCLYSVAILK